MNSIEELIDSYYTQEGLDKYTFLQQRDEFIVLCRFLDSFKPINILEIGVRGASFNILSKFASGTKIAVDVCDYSSSIENGIFIQGNSHDEETIETIKSVCQKFDFIFIDGDHSIEGVALDFNSYKPLLSERGYMGFHDVDPDHIFKGKEACMGGYVHKFWQSIQEGSKTSIICSGTSSEVGYHVDGKKFKTGFGGIGLWRPK
jgi:cephalosporin hydroxylase